MVEVHSIEIFGGVLKKEANEHSPIRARKVDNALVGGGIEGVGVVGCRSQCQSQLDCCQICSTISKQVLVETLRDGKLRIVDWIDPLPPVCDVWESEYDIALGQVKHDPRIQCIHVWFDHARVSRRS